MAKNSQEWMFERKGKSRINGTKSEFQSLFNRKQNDIVRLVCGLEAQKIISEKTLVEISDSGIAFRIQVGDRLLKLDFILLEKNQNKHRIVCTSDSQKAVIRFGVNTDNNELKKAVLEYIQSIEKGIFAEHLCTLALEELKLDGLVNNFRKGTNLEDINGIDFIIDNHILVQVKSSYMSLRAEINKLREKGIAGLFIEKTGDEKKNIEQAKDKILSIIEGQKKGELIYA